MALICFAHRLDYDRLQLITERSIQNIALDSEASYQRLAVSAIKVGELVGEGRDKVISGVYTVVVPGFVEEKGRGKAMIPFQFLAQAHRYCGLPLAGRSLQPDKTRIAF
jgi:hypothetical protein